MRGLKYAHIPNDKNLELNKINKLRVFMEN
jgi:hypothetical protein